MSHPIPVNQTRRDFITLTAMATLAAATTPVFASALQAAGRSKRPYPLGIQLYSLRGELARDLPGTLKQVAALGYDNVEFYAPYFEWTTEYAQEVRRMLDGEGLNAFTTHNHIESFTGAGVAKAIELNAALGSRHLILASAPKSTQTAEDWKRLCGELTRSMDALRTQGMTAGFHNHESEWHAAPGSSERVMDLIAANTPKEFVLQFDVGTCIEAGADPIAWIRAHPGRIRSVHLKDWAPGKEEDQKGFRVLFNEGASPWKAIFAALESTGGVEFYLMEQEGSRYSEFETAERCIQNWNTLRGEG